MDSLKANIIVCRQIIGAERDRKESRDGLCRTHELGTEEMA